MTESQQQQHEKKKQRKSQRKWWWWWWWKEMKRSKMYEKRSKNSHRKTTAIKLQQLKTSAHKWNSWGPVKCFRSKVFKELCVEKFLLFLSFLRSPIRAVSARSCVPSAANVAVAAFVLWLNHAYHRLWNGRSTKAEYFHYIFAHIGIGYAATTKIDDTLRSNQPMQNGKWRTTTANWG